VTRLAIVLGGHWDVQMGGAQYQAKCLLDALANAPDFETYYLAQAVPADLKRGHYEIVPFSTPQTRTKGLTALPSLYGKLKALKPDVVYQRCLMPYTGACAFYAARNDARFVFHVASDDDVTPLKPGAAMVHKVARAVGEYGVRHADQIIVQTGDQARKLRETYGLEAAAVVPNFQPAPTEQPSVHDPKTLRVIWVGNFKAVKRPDLFVDLAAHFANRTDLRFVMIGRPGEPAQYGALHQKMKSLPNLEYLGEQPIERVNSEIAASDVLVTTSAYEGFPNTFIQAWLRGVPVVSNRVDPDGCLTKGGAGLLVGEREGLVRAIGELHADRTRLAALAKAAREYGFANHLPDKADRLISLLRKA
jgi:glycosyltransferase involved in cell wall biosynthesis